jgi:hypothetical protein
MTVNRKAKLILVWIALCLLVLPVLNTVLTTTTILLFEPASYDSLRFNFISLVWAWTLVLFGWTLLTFVVVPYSALWVYTSLRSSPFLLKLLVFYILLVLMGLLLPEASIRESFNRGDHNRIYLLYFFMAITLCPLCNLILKWLTKEQQH